MHHSILPAVLFCAAISGAGSALAAQYAEPGARVLFEQTIGPAQNLFGWAVAPLGDVNGDAVIDLAVAAPFATAGGHSSAGRVYALSGADGSTLWSKSESRTSAILGYALETLDWNADGVLDVVAGAPFAATGRTWVLSGVDGSTLATLTGEATNDGFGASLATGGDFDGDGFQDLLVAAPFHDGVAGSDSGKVYVFTRGALTPYTTLEGAVANGVFGIGLAFVGDASSPPNGRAELVAGSRDPASFFDGRADVYEWNGLAPTFRFGVTGVGMGFDLMGDRIDGGADVDGDGRPDFLVGDMFHEEVELFSGANGALLHTLDGAGEGGSFGSARLIPDADGDGRADVAVGAWKNASGAPNGGKVFVYSGASGALQKTITSTSSEQNLGIDVRGIEDFNGDGKRDLVVGAYGDGFGGPLPGAAIVFSGHLAAPANASDPAELLTDPALTDAGGDPATGPLIGSPFEVFNLALDCQNAPAPGFYAMQVRTTRLGAPLATSLGRVWMSGPLLLVFTGTHAQNVVVCTPNGTVLPTDPALVGLDFTAQGFCGARLSNALTQTIGG